MGQIEEAKVSCLNILTCHRELLVSRLRSIRCILDNLSACGFFCEEDVEIIQQMVTKTNQVEKTVKKDFRFAFIESKKPKIHCFIAVKHLLVSKLKIVCGIIRIFCPLVTF